MAQGGRFRRRFDRVIAGSRHKIAASATWNRHLVCYFIVDCAAFCSVQMVKGDIEMGGQVTAQYRIGSNGFLSRDQVDRI